MCGILGLTWRDDKRAQKALESIRHRGPDDEGIEHGTVTLGATRLSIQDLSAAGHMPMQREHLTIVFNGEVVNFRDIRKQLERKFEFESDSDSEVVLRAYQSWGSKCLEKFNGMFAFCIHDSKRNELFIARDRFGIKPLYYLHDARGLAFCSEIRGLLHFMANREIDPAGLRQFFTFRFTIGETTMLKGVKKLRAGHFLTYKIGKGELSTKRWYSLPTISRASTLQDDIGDVRSVLDDAVRDWLVSDVPVACLLSGGLDSSIIAALAKRHDANLHTYSIGFDTTNELPDAELVAKHLGTNHHAFRVSTKSMLQKINLMIEHLDEPIGDPGFLPVLELSSRMKGHAKVVLTGDGGDELFAGYDRYKLFKYGMVLRNILPWHFGNDVLKRVVGMRGKNEYGAFVECIRLFEERELKQIGVQSWDASNSWDASTPLRAAQQFDLCTLVPDDFFMKTDKMGSACSLEYRPPMFDHRVVEFAFSLRRDRLLHGWNEKYILKRAFAHLLPSHTTKRRKQGFNVPIDAWFAGPLNGKLRALVDKSSHGLYSKDYVFDLLDKAKSTRGGYKARWILSQKLWSIYVFERWHARVIA